MILDSSYRLALTSASSSGHLRNSLLVFCKIRNENVSRPFRLNAQQVSRCCCIVGLNPTQLFLQFSMKKAAATFLLRHILRMTTNHCYNQTGVIENLGCTQCNCSRKFIFYNSHVYLKAIVCSTLRILNLGDP